jgi:hypothetical protein
MNQGAKGLVLALALFVFSACTIETQADASGGNNHAEANAMSDELPTTIKTGWSKSGTLTSLDQTVKQFMQVDFPEPGQYTVQFTVGSVPRPNSLFRQRAKAVVTWSVGNSVSRQISLYDGASISGVGQAVKVVMTDDSVRVAGGPDVNQPYDVSCQVARGTRPSQNQPPTYQFEVETPGATATTVAIPQGIGAISTYIQGASDLTGLTVTIDVLDAGGSGLQHWLLDDTSVPQWRPLPPGATSLQFTRSNVFSHPRIAIFIGIDG